MALYILKWAWVWLCVLGFAYGCVISVRDWLKAPPPYDREMGLRALASGASSGYRRHYGRSGDCVISWRPTPK